MSFTGLERSGAFERSHSRSDLEGASAPVESGPRRDRHTITRLDLSNAVYRSCPRISRREAQNLVDEVLETIAAALQGGEKVGLHGFGKFEVARTKGREGRNPRTGAPAYILERNALRFRPSPILEALVAGARKEGA